jgi:hypothetical protein
MTQSEFACPKCRHQMQEGFPLDRAPTPAQVGPVGRRSTRVWVARPKVGSQKAIADHALPLPIVRLPRSLRQTQITLNVCVDRLSPGDRSPRGWDASVRAGTGKGSSKTAARALGMTVRGPEDF